MSYSCHFNLSRALIIQASFMKQSVSIQTATTPNKNVEDKTEIF